MDEPSLTAEVRGLDLLLVVVVLSSAVSVLGGVAWQGALLFAIAWFVLIAIPGEALMTVLCPRVARSRADAAVVAAGLGLAAQAFLFIASRLIGVPSVYVLTSGGLALVGARCLWRRRGARRTVSVIRPSRWEVALAVAAGLALTLRFYSAFVYSPYPVPARGVRYHPDLVWHQSIAAEVANHVPPTMAWMGGSDWGYHWFAHVHLAAMSDAVGLELDVIVLRLYLAPLILLAMLGLGALARATFPEAPRWSAVLAAGLPVLVGEPDFEWGNAVRFLGVYGEDLFLSPSFLFGLVLFMAVALVSVRGEFGRRMPAGERVAAGLLVATGVGAKASFGPTVVAGLMIVFLHSLAYRGLRPTLRAMGTYCAVVVAVSLGTGAFVFAGADVGARPSLATVSRLIEAAALPSTGWALLVSGAVVLTALLVPLAGVPWALTRRRYKHSEGELFLIGMLGAGFVGFLVIDHPGFSQLYILYYGFSAGFAVSAAGLSHLVVELRRDAGYGLTTGPPRGGRSTGRAFAVVTVVLLGLGAADGPFDVLPVLQKQLHGEVVEDRRGTLLTADLVAGMRFVRSHSVPDDKIAVDRHSVGDGRSLMFYYSAYSERRVYIESWGYTPDALRSEHRSVPPEFSSRLALNRRAFIGDPDALLELTRAGVRFLVHDRLSGYGDEEALDQVLTPAIRNHAVTVYSLADCAEDSRRLPGPTAMSESCRRQEGT